MSRGDTIAALATAPGISALAVVRLTGPDAVAIADRCFNGSKALTDHASRTAIFGRFQAKEEVLDHIVATVYRSPASATGEDMVELSCHGGGLVYRRILASLYEAGARPARAGEFTERAFLNGKLDLTQAEAVADLIHASSEAAQRVAVRHLEGRYSQLLDQLRDELIDVSALMELELDFSEEDVEFAQRDRLVALVERGSETVRRLLSSVRTGEHVRGGLNVVIAGRPNAGKSTMLNAILGKGRAIVSESPGTTRDTIEAEAEIHGMLVRFVDTAGLRGTDDRIEAIGVERAREAMANADLVLYLYDGSIGLDPDEHREIAALRESAPPVLVLANKADAMTTEALERARRSGHRPVSAERGLRDESALAPAMDGIRSLVESDADTMDAGPIVTHERHTAHLREAAQALQRAEEGLKAGTTGDFLVPDLKRAADAFGCITGAITNEDVLGAIFSRFCIGK